MFMLSSKLSVMLSRINPIKIISNKHVLIIGLNLLFLGHGFSQPLPRILNINYTTVNPNGDVEIQALGVFLFNPVGITVGSCDCIPIAGKKNDPNYITCMVSASDIASSGCVGSFQMTVTTVAGSATTGPLIAIEPLPVIDPISPIYLSRATAIPDSLREAYNYNIQADSGFIPRSFQFEWDLAIPLPSPLPTTRFSNRETNQQSNIFTYSSSAEQLETVLNDIEYPVQVDSVTTVIFADPVTTVQKRKYKYYIEQAGPFPTSLLPGFFGLGLAFTGDTVSYDTAIDIDIYSSTAGNSFRLDIWPGALSLNDFYEDDDLEPELSRNIIDAGRVIHQVIFDEHNIAAPDVVVDSTVNNSGTPFQLNLEHQRYKEYFPSTYWGDTSWVTYSIKRATDTAITASQIQLSLSGTDSSSFSVMDIDTISLTNDSTQDFRVAYHPKSNAVSHNANMDISVGGRSYKIPLIGALADTTRPSLSITDTNGVLSGGDTAVFTLSFSEPISAFTQASLSFIPGSSASSAVVTL